MMKYTAGGPYTAVIKQYLITDFAGNEAALRQKEIFNSVRPFVEGIGRLL